MSRLPNESLRWFPLALNYYPQGFNGTYSHYIATTKRVYIPIYPVGSGFGGTGTHLRESNTAFYSPLLTTLRNINNKSGMGITRGLAREHLVEMPFAKQLDTTPPMSCYSQKVYSCSRDAGASQNS